MLEVLMYGVFRDLNYIQTVGDDTHAGNVKLRPRVSWKKF